MIEFKYGNHNIKINCDQHEYLFKYITKHKNFFEETYLRFLKNIINDESVVVDVGAHIGNHTIYFSKVLEAKKVISIEPTRRSYEVLCDNIELNDLRNVTTYRVAAGSSSGIGKCCVRKSSNSGANSWGISVEEVGNEGEVSVVLLDDIIKEKVDFIKIDVETFEIDVLKGAFNIIKEYSPDIMIEVSRNNLNVFEKMMNEFNYIYTGAKVFEKNTKAKASSLLIVSSEKEISKKN